MSFLDDYEPVEDRIRKFWEDHPSGRIVTRLLSHDTELGNYVVQASVWRSDTEDAVAPAATGLAQESKPSMPKNMQASALEVCETSAIGRALANLGYAAKGKRPSREEMASKREGSGGESVAYGEGAAGKNTPGSSRSDDGCQHKYWADIPNRPGWMVCEGCGWEAKGSS